MTLKKTFEMITSKTNEAAKQQDEITRKLEANKSEKAKAEEAKAAALNAKDEQAYRAACRNIADNEASIEFNTICLQEIQKKQLATDAVDQEIRRGLYQGMNDIYAGAINEIEKALSVIVHEAEEAVKKLNEINTMALSWDEQVMKHPRNPAPADFTYDKRIPLKQFANYANGRLIAINSMKKVDPGLKTEGGK